MFLSNTKLEQFLTDLSCIICNCVNSRFKDFYHEHLITGDLGTIKNTRLRKRFIKVQRNHKP